MVVEETSSFSMDDKKARSPTVVQDSKAVADAEEAVADAKAAAAAAGGDGEDECPTWMTWTQFVVANKRLSREEIDSILSRQRKPFESTDLYEDMIEDSSTTKEDLEREAADHEYHEDKLSVWRDRVRKEYADKGFFAVDDDYIAERLELEEYNNQSVREMLSELNLDASIFGDE